MTAFALYIGLTTALTLAAIVLLMQHLRVTEPAKKEPLL